MNKTDRRPFLRPEDMNVHMLITEIAKITKSEVHEQSDAFGLSQGFRQMIFHLAHTGGITQQELSTLAHLKPPTVSVSLQKMEEAGLVVRIPDEKDKRKTIVKLTKKGREIDESIRRVFVEQNRRIAEALTPEEAATLKALLIKARAHLLEGKENKEKRK